ncbi:MAG TPA: hypothetical protein VJV78_01950, partial [Polyangiales bacterium]|nr:hypothetical protein [Polyangiales bacterium]
PRSAAPQAGAQPGETCRELETRILNEPEPSAAADAERALLRIALAECYARLGRTASAWAQFREAAAAARDAGQPELEGQARARAKALEPELSYLTVSTWKSQRVLVTSDDAPLDDAVLGSAIPVDPGRHVIAASAPGKRAWSTAIELGAHGDHITVSVPVLPDDVELLHDELRAPPVATSVPPEAEGSDGSLQRTLGLVAGAIGIAGIATGTVFGVKAASDWADAKAQCNPYPYCGSEGARLAHDANTSAWISNISFVTGIAGLTGGAVLWFTAPDEEQKAPKLGVGVGRVMLRGQL